MKIILISLIIAVLVCVPLCNAAELAGVRIPDAIQAGQTELILNGAGIRTKYFIKLYVGGLYLQEKSTDPNKIIEADEAMAIKLHIISSMITSKKMEESTREGFMNATKGNTAPIADKIEKFISVFKEEIKENDIYDLIYRPGEGLAVYKNNRYHSQIEGFDFKQALFGIWFCDKPAQKSLKNKMLGK